MRDAKPLPRRRKAAAPDSPEPSEPSEPVEPARPRPAPAKPRAVTPSPPPPRPPQYPELRPDAAPGVDKRLFDRLRRGQLPIEATLDLHGMTQAEAHRALDDFIANGRRVGRRCLLVVTGKGGRGQDDVSALAGGVLRRAVPGWLNAPANREQLLAFAPARPKHGGWGALYLLLRRQR